MNAPKAKDVAASVRARLLHFARESGQDFQLVLTRYANERFLYRLSISHHAQQFVLKGASLFTLWAGAPHRATRDIDLLGFGDPGTDRVREVVSEVLSIEVEDDGIRFNPDSLSVGPIREDQEYGGIRAELVGRVVRAQVRLQIDIGFGDAITPEAKLVDYPVLLDFPAPRLRAYPRETVVAEKIEAMVHLGMANSRMKDFYDLAVLARDFDFDAEVLVRAIQATFSTRRTPLPRGLPTALTQTFYADQAKQTQWSAFIRKAGIGDAAGLQETVEAIAAFLEVPLEAAASGPAPSSRWVAGGPWRGRGR